MVTGVRSVTADIVGHGLPLVLLQSQHPGSHPTDGAIAGSSY
jgi:hypothetical protein